MFHCFVNTFIYDKRSINFLPISKTHTHTFIYNIYSCIYTYTHTYIHTPSGNQTRQWKLPVNCGFPIAMFDCQRVCIHYTSLNTNHTPTWLLQKSFKIPAFYPTIHPLYTHYIYTHYTPVRVVAEIVPHFWVAISCHIKSIMTLPKAQIFRLSMYSLKLVCRKSP